MRLRDRKRGKAFRVPTFLPDGSVCPAFYRIKFDPPLEGDDGKPVKTKQAAGQEARISFLPHVEGKSWAEQLAAKSDPWMWCESDFKAGAAAAAGYWAMTTGSVWSHRKRTVDGEPAVIADLDRYDFKGAHVVLVPDNDVHGNSGVQDAVLDLDAELRQRGAKTSIMLLPPPEFDPNTRQMIKLGLDDYQFKNRFKRAAMERLPILPLSDARFAGWGKYRKPPTASALTALPPVDKDWLTTKPADLEFVWNALLPRHGVGLLVAEGGIGKTQLAIDLALGVATGQKMLGLRTRRGRVLYLGLEDPPDVLRRRIYFAHKRRRNAAAKRGRRKAFDSDVRSNLVPISLVGQQFHLIELERGTVRQAATLDALIRLLKTYGPFELVVLDPMSRLHGMDENANAIATAIINSAERIAREVPTTVLIAHHTGKANASKQAEHAYSARGASGLADAARVVLRLRELGAKECEGITNIKPGTAVLKLVHAKSNYSKKYKDVYLQRAGDGLLRLFDPEFRNANNYDLWFSKLRDWVTANDVEHFTRRQVTQDRLRDVSGETTSRDNARRFFDQAVEDERVVPSSAVKGGTSYTLAKEELE
jgi:regulatory protein RepA